MSARSMEEREAEWRQRVREEAERLKDDLRRKSASGASGGDGEEGAEGVEGAVPREMPPPPKPDAGAKGQPALPPGHPPLPSDHPGFGNMTPEMLAAAARGGCPVVGLASLNTSGMKLSNFNPDRMRANAGPKPDSPNSSNPSSSVDDQTHNALAKLVVDNMLDAMLIVTGEGLIVQLNEATVKMFGYTRREMMGRNVKMLMPQSIAVHHDRFMKLFVDKIRLGKAQLEETSKIGKLRQLYARRKDGTKFPIELMINPIQDPNDEGSLLISGYIRDLSDRRVAQKAVENRDRQLALRKASEQLLGYINHEIRDPLHGMRGLLDLVRQEFAAASQQKRCPSRVQLTRLRTDIEHLNELTNMLGLLVNDVLDLRKVEEGKLPLEIAPCSLNNLVLRASYVLRPRLLEKQHVKFVVNTLEQDMTVYVDAHRVIQVVVNLLSNAIKFTDEGSIHMSVIPVVMSDKDDHPAGLERSSSNLSQGSLGNLDSARLHEHDGASAGSGGARKSGGNPDNDAHSQASAGDDEPTHFRIVVTDTGCGIAEKDHPRIFKPFYQGADGAGGSHRPTGTGLGLHLCQQIARVMHGSISFISTEGEGSSFWIQLPLGSQANSSSPAENNNKAASGAGNAKGGQPQVDLDSFKCKARFLVVDDIALNRSLMKRILLSFGAEEVVEAADGQEAVDAMVEANGNFDVVFMDNVMPVMDGMQATREIKKLQYPAPIIGLTGNISSESIQEARDAGMEDVMEKPCSKARIAQCLVALGVGAAKS